MENTAAPAAAAARPRPHSSEPPRYRRPAPWLGLVALAYAVVQLAVVIPHTGHALGWDESVYVSQVDPRNPAAFFSAPRSRGISLLVAPIVAATSSIPVLRVLLTVLSALALYTSFRVWTRLLPRTTVALAALLFSGLWITMISGPAVMPNLWVALGAVATVGWFLRVPADRNARWWLAAVLAGVTLVRTPDGGWLGLPLLVAAIAVRTWRPALPAVVGGLLLGAAQWIGEAYDRFGGITQRLDVSSDVEGGMGLHFAVGAALRSLNGPQLCRPCEVPLRHPELTVWWLALPLLTAVALVAALRDRHRRRTRVRVGLGRPEPRRAPGLPTTLLPVICAGALALPYLLLIDYSAPRFLMPTYALLALPIAGLVFRAVRIAKSPRHMAVALGVVVALQVASQYAVLSHAAGQSDTVNGRYRTAADALARMGLRPPCLVIGDRALPIAYHAGCSSAQTSGNNKSLSTSALLRRAGREPTALLVKRGHGRPPSYARDWIAYPLRGTEWNAHLPVEQAREMEARKSGQETSGKPGTMGGMTMNPTTSWSGFQAAEPGFATAAEDRFGRYRHHVLATLRQDGAPRLTPFEVDFRDGELWLGMMSESRKALDLRRDPRFSVQANPGPEAGPVDGDVRVSGRAVEVTDPEVIARYAEAVRPPEPFHLFRAEVSEVVHTSVEGSELVLRTWRPGEPVRILRRGGDDGPPRVETPPGDGGPAPTEGLSSTDGTSSTDGPAPTNGPPREESPPRYETVPSDASVPPGMERD
ncbi:pyridoxamine 5'-phosphate oxidase family protein [Streptomyces sp. NA02950]|uniref:pyridoxamine 5'-phosphate oxidase family protein n=1 Tax=Streptomyces sp. NA02950 TaxID=2742137 RepID=UPI00159265CF|nr:pyridoxamine 5'-phosphate oxidase family protein [Streptomyces sp. NA02950]QKV91385.1 pyridoxamine 5'-phosphate oxidase family protein [Streptomyces sp. NA02950]